MSLIRLANHCFLPYTLELPKFNGFNKGKHGYNESFRFEPTF